MPPQNKKSTAEQKQNVENTRLQAEHDFVKETVRAEFTGQSPEEVEKGRRAVYEAMIYQESIDEKLKSIASAQVNQHSEFAIFMQRVDDWNNRVEAQIFDKSTGDSKIVWAREKAEAAMLCAKRAENLYTEAKKDMAGNHKALMTTVIMGMITLLIAMAGVYALLFQHIDKSAVPEHVQATAQTQPKGNVQ